MLTNSIVILVVVTIFRGWVMYQMQRQSWNSGGFSKKTLLLLNVFTIAAALVSAVIIAGTEEKHAFLLGLLGLLAFWFISLAIPRVLHKISK